MLALRALQVAEGTTQLEEAVALIAKEQEAHDVHDVSHGHIWPITGWAVTSVVQMLHLYTWSSSGLMQSDRSILVKI